MSIKLVAIDLDGTLLNNEKKISARNKEMIQKGKAAGVKMVLCTGRPLKSVLPMLEELGLTDSGDYTVTLNGGLIQENHTGERLSETRMTLENIQEIYELSQELDLSTDIVSGATVYRVMPNVPTQPSVYGRLNRILTFEERHISQFDAETPYHKMVMTNDDPNYLTEKQQAIPEQFHQKYNIVRSGQNLFEFVPKTVSKANGLEALGNILGIDASEMMAIGDEENDYSMIDFVGTGVAMGNATPIIKEIAQYETKTNEEDGVAHAIETWVLK
ncbi:Cof-type HAD-IIB family hydrolase [Vagococcus lutrae]|uniref:HAD superfamily hydrolase n=2 Tax=Vagococcus lutrae TaxID=81947 RepID=V6Q621_9ENTE|nr:Cof-type HAD-IIB family hydrolase [Vagococcus lutrae]EST90217.1 hypothetical protein T233_00783 [Vagococcus lutrae LBD1]MDT2801290.1 Cof-type HAD-IIB family hydrolase [Vagococcus lutrae]MDT2811975.1 Cof-type HAD-IIB family hydrolase [Vagococcus lutrae]MDT2841437.1 Cof-type HAD-IIB family hydrolase [Vagococcus lutrae]UQF38465.1 Cof-type HAD-IIB family hydrolase [Vagococcus lutrae]